MPPWECRPTMVCNHAMRSARLLFIVVLCLAVAGPIWPKLLVKAMCHPTEGVVGPDDLCDSDEGLPGVLPATVVASVEPVGNEMTPVVVLPVADDFHGTPSGPRAPPTSLQA